MVLDRRNGDHSPRKKSKHPTQKGRKQHSVPPHAKDQLQPYDDCPPPPTALCYAGEYPVDGLTILNEESALVPYQNLLPWRDDANCIDPISSYPTYTSPSLGLASDPHVELNLALESLQVSERRPPAKAITCPCVSPYLGACHPKRRRQRH